MYKHYKITVLSRPQMKERPRLARGGRAYTPKKTQDYERLIAKTAREQIPDIEPITTKNISFIVRVYMPTKVHGDIDNYVKIAQDGLNKVAYDDDKQIKHIEGFLYYDKENPRMEIEVIEREEI